MSDDYDGQLPEFVNDGGQDMTRPTPSTNADEKYKVINELCVYFGTSLKDDTRPYITKTIEQFAGFLVADRAHYLPKDKVRAAIDVKQVIPPDSGLSDYDQGRKDTVDEIRHALGLEEE